MMPAPLFGELPALPLHTAGKYVAGAYVVIFALVLIYVVILAIRVTRMERRLGELLEEQTPSAPQELDAPRPESTLV
jgi:CcmD family protein